MDSAESIFSTSGVAASVVCERANGTAGITMSASGANVEYIGWRIESATSTPPGGCDNGKDLVSETDPPPKAVPNEGNIGSVLLCDQTSTLTPTENDREFYVKVFCDGSPEPDCKKNPNEQYLCDEDGGAAEEIIEIKVTILKVESIDGYVYGESGRKIANMEDLPDPANVVASGYMKFKATILPSSISDTLYYKWTATGGTLTSPEGTGNSFLEVKWDAPDGHEQDVTLTLEVKQSASGPTICTETVDLRTIRPYVVRVKFVDDFWNEEQQIYDGGDPEFDAVAGDNYPVCYVMHRGMQTQVDIAGEKDDDSVNDLTKKTPIKLTAKAAYGGIENQFDEDSMDDDTENWSALDYGTVEIESDDNVPEKVTEYEDFEMHWTFKVKNSSGSWITAYQEETGYSQKTVHKETSGSTTYGLYTVFDVYECDAEHFTKSHIDDAVGWAPNTSSPSEHDVAHNVMQEVNGNITTGCICPGAWSTAWSEDCWTGARGDHSSGMCCCRAHGMMLALQVLGVGVYTHVFVNERPEPGEKDTNPSSPVFCSGCGHWCYRGAWWGSFWNNWQGACRSGGSGSTCYAPAGQFEGSYNDIRSDFGPYYWIWGADFADKCPGGTGHLSPP